MFPETFLSTVFLPLLILTPEEMIPQLAGKTDEAIQVDFADAEHLGKLSADSFQHPKYAAVMKKYLPMFLHKGLLDL